MSGDVYACLTKSTLPFLFPTVLLISNTHSERQREGRKEGGRERKEEWEREVRYEGDLDLAASVQRVGCKITVEVGSTGLVNPTGFEKLANIHTKTFLTRVGSQHIVSL